MVLWSIWPSTFRTREVPDIRSCSASSVISSVFQKLNWQEFHQVLMELDSFSLSQSAGFLAFLRLYLQVAVANPDLLAPIHHAILDSKKLPWHKIDLSVVDEVFEGGIFAPLLEGISCVPYL